jgi:hypothetical protein
LTGSVGYRSADCLGRKGLGEWKIIGYAGPAKSAITGPE